MLDRCYEILDTLWRHKLRTALTALSVAWGILMLVILLAAGNGLKNAQMANFADDAPNAVFVFPGKTTMPHKGYRVGRQVKFDDDDLAAVDTELPNSSNETGRTWVGSENTVRYGAKYSAYTVMAVHPGYKIVENTLVVAGRYINDLDIQQRRKVCVIGVDVVEELFAEGQDPVGEMIDINRTLYKVVGVFLDEGSERMNRNILMPMSTAQLAYSLGRDQRQLLFTFDGPLTVENAQQSEDATRQLLAQRKDFADGDERALRVNVPLERLKDIQALFGGINIFIWIMGIGTIIAGIVGVSNIMLISVRERTKEFGIRKALGATPFSIVSQVVLEALVLTSVAGYLGLLVGVGLLEFVNTRLLSEQTNEYIRDPSVDLGVVVMASLLLVAAGVLAGYFPARGAARVDPVVALRDE